MSIRDLKSPRERRSFIEKETKTRLKHIPNSTLETAQNVHCENLIGATTIPLGIAGPLFVHGKSKKNNFFIPLATTEGALVASVNRGAKAITEAGGAEVMIEKTGTTRGPVFYTGSIKQSHTLTAWIEKHKKKLSLIAKQTSKHITLKDITLRALPNYIFVRFSYDTSDAMGMNMVTIATTAITEEIEKQTGFSCLSIAGNFDIDKKPSYLNFHEGRGYTVWAEITLSGEILQKVLKTSAQALYDVWLGKNILGSVMSGSLGYNAHFANIIAALFLATGQDPAHVVEGSMGVTTATILENNSLYFSVYLPAIMVGTVGGGTSLPTQQEALKILGIEGSGKTDMFAEIVGGAVLAGEISLLASLAQGTLAKSHQKLGR